MQKKFLHAQPNLPLQVFDAAFELLLLSDARHELAVLLHPLELGQHLAGEKKQ